MFEPILPTKLYTPRLRSKMVRRLRLLRRLNDGLGRKLTLISASPGCGKTTLVSQWLAGCPRPAAWLSMDEEDRDPVRFLTYLFAAMREVGIDAGEGILGTLQTSRSLRLEMILAALLPKISVTPEPFILVLDDYHVVDSKTMDDAVAWLIEHMPPQMHLVIVTRQDPDLPLARLRVRNELTEVRTNDLRFTTSETAEFLGTVMGLSLSEEDIVLLATRTEGWIAGLQLAALSMQGHPDASGFVQSFTGSHHHVMDYLVEEVLQTQPVNIQDFLLHTSILDRLSGPLCDAVFHMEAGNQEDASRCGQDMLEYLERANLFIVPLDNMRHWYRYHHLFADLLRKRLHQRIIQNQEKGVTDIAELHIRASAWYEDNGLVMEAFHHAAAAHDVDRAVRLIEGGGMPLLFRGAITPILNWLESLPQTELDARPSLYVMHASALLMAGQMKEVERKLQAAEHALQGAGQAMKTPDLIGHMASIRAALAVSRHQADTILAESRLALEHLHQGNLPVRAATMWSLGYAHQLQGDHAAAGLAYSEALSISRKIGHLIITIMAELGLGNIREADNQLRAAAGAYQQVLGLAGDPPLPAACEAYLGLARIAYERNDLDTAERYALRAFQLAQQFEDTDRAVACEVFLAKLKLALGEWREAAAVLARADRSARQQHFLNQIPHIAEVQVLILLHQGDVEEADRLAQQYGLQFSKARVHLAKDHPTAALDVLETLRRQAEANNREDERLKVMVLQAIALHGNGDKIKAVKRFADALALAESEGFIRTFVDEGAPMKGLLREAAGYGIMPNDLGKLLTAMEAEGLGIKDEPDRRSAQAGKLLIEPLSNRELEVLRLIAQGLSNREISERLFIALTTVKGHNRIIFDKLQVKRRTEAVARARQLGLL
ncbi:LuxR family transcriptional regulator [Paenibacillus donghaensis]|uniref:LuxR C-terminal-related transcriptional regulator n=1 Tax=Paenibacillus donghaensis TaxID=414771 RepID=UPI0018846FE9|nr:LuxR C-terminal-related transcriptional regulator [Paenibacillus donghaensis]MBE9918157.1 LuxR family transcriptional regulator [Paenibacillus donghaensis]